VKELDKNIKRKYSISDYNPNWVNQFNFIKRFISSVFGIKAIQIEHVGSTSIPGMKAKPLIDVLVVVEKMEDFMKEKKEMTAANYEWDKDVIAPNSLLFFKMGINAEKLENIHVFEKDAPHIQRFLAKRDYLRAFPDKAKKYSDLKEKIAQKYPEDYETYRKAKEPFLAQIEPEAYKWWKSRKIT
jgi:GrpB-like predicted nucleotidyltransferase (UPF0157 family)